LVLRSWNQPKVSATTARRRSAPPKLHAYVTLRKIHATTNRPMEQATNSPATFTQNFHP